MPPGSHLATCLGSRGRSRSVVPGGRMLELHLGAHRSHGIVGLLDHELRHNLEVDGGDSARQLQYQQLQGIAGWNLDWKRNRHVICGHWPIAFDQLQLYRRSNGQ
jgi:hypothetical protein